MKLMRDKTHRHLRIRAECVCVANSIKREEGMFSVYLRIGRVIVNAPNIVAAKAQFDAKETLRQCAK